MNPLTWILKSFTSDKDGGSARKLSAFFGIVVISGNITLRYTTAENLTEVVIVWLSFAALCLGMVTIQQLIELKNGKKDENQIKEG